jgi:hypothetical protein
MASIDFILIGEVFMFGDRVVKVSFPRLLRWRGGRGWEVIRRGGSFWRSGRGNSRGHLVRVGVKRSVISREGQKKRGRCGVVRVGRGRENGRSNVSSLGPQVHIRAKSGGRGLCSAHLPSIIHWCLTLLLSRSYLACVTCHFTTTVK